MISTPYRARAGTCHYPEFGLAAGLDFFAGFQRCSDRAIVKIIQFTPDGHTLRQRGQAYLTLKLVCNVMGGGLTLNCGIQG